METQHASRSPFPDLVAESFEESLFLWRRWEAELTSLTRNLDAVWSWTEDRLQGALAGVRIGTDALLSTCEAALASEDSTTITVGAALLAATEQSSAISMLSNALRDSNGTRLAAMIRGLEVAGSRSALSAAATTLAGGSAVHAAALLRLKTFRSAAPAGEMRAAYDSNAPEMQSAVLRATRYSDDQLASQWVEEGLQSPHSEVRNAAVVAGLSRGSQVAWNAAVSWASGLAPNSAPYLTMVGLLGAASEHEIVYAALRRPELQRDAIWALGHIGTVRAVECCLHGIKHEKLARQAAEAYCYITGAELERDRLAIELAAEEAPSFENDDLDADLVPPAEDFWPTPDVAAVNAHWEKIRPAFAADVRYVRGRPLSTATLVAEVETGPMLRRPDLILNLAAITRGRYDVQPRAFAARQKHMMRQSRMALANEGA